MFVKTDCQKEAIVEKKIYFSFYIAINLSIKPFKVLLSI